MIRRFLNATGGASAVEFALILPPFVMLVFGIFEISQMVFVSSSVQWSVDRAARLAVIDTDLEVADIEADIRERLAVSNSPEVEITITREVIATVDVVRVAAHYDHDVEGPLIPSFTVGFDFETMIPQP